MSLLYVFLISKNIIEKKHKLLAEDVNGFRI